eukprot:SM000023S07593  [mRNA]  locus=s23:381543:384181:+ [translate_table: standard]
MGGLRSGANESHKALPQPMSHLTMTATSVASSSSLASPSSSSQLPMLSTAGDNKDTHWENLEHMELVEKGVREPEAKKAGPVPAVATNSLTIVLVGKSGNGKSATGNSILNKKVFKSARSQRAVTSTCELAHVDRSDGRHINVIDTPGLFGPATSPESLSKEISRCIALARDGLHALLLVLSTRNRFTPEEAAAVDSLQVIFGDRILNYMIIVFTGGDELEESSDDYLSGCCECGAGPLEALLQRCGDRKFVFDNKTKDPRKQELQSQELLNMVESLVQSNGGQPYTNLLFQEAQPSQEEIVCQEIAENAKASQLELIKQMGELHNGDVRGEEILQQMQALHKEQLHRVTKMIEEGLRKQVEEKQQALQAHQAILEERLAREIEAREAAERTATTEREHGGKVYPIVEEWMQEHCFEQLHCMGEQRSILQEILDGGRTAKQKGQSAAREERLQADQVADTFGMQAILGNELAMEKKARKEAESNLRQVQDELDRVREQRRSLSGCTIL